MITVLSVTCPCDIFTIGEKCDRGLWIILVFCKKDMNKCGDFVHKSSLNAVFRNQIYDGEPRFILSVHRASNKCLLKV